MAQQHKSLGRKLRSRGLGKNKRSFKNNSRKNDWKVCVEGSRKFKDIDNFNSETDLLNFMQSPVLNNLENHPKFARVVRAWNFDSSKNQQNVDNSAPQNDLVNQ
jgi:hypothetical protein